MTPLGLAQGVGIYIMVYTIILENGYMSFYPTVASFKLKLQQPNNPVGCIEQSNDCHDVLRHASAMPYCKQAQFFAS